MAKHAKTMSERQFAKHTGKALSTIQEARKAGRLAASVSRDARGRIRIDPVIAAEELAAYTQLRITEGGGDVGSIEAWRVARARREVALAALAEDELRVKRGGLVDARGIEAKIVDVFTHSKNKLLGVPSRLKQRCPHLTLADIGTIDDLIREALEELAEGVSKGGAL